MFSNNTYMVQYWGTCSCLCLLVYMLLSLPLVEPQYQSQAPGAKAKFASHHQHHNRSINSLNSCTSKYRHFGSWPNLTGHGSRAGCDVKSRMILYFDVISKVIVTLNSCAYPGFFDVLWIRVSLFIVILKSSGAISVSPPTKASITAWCKNTYWS